MKLVSFKNAAMHICFWQFTCKNTIFYLTNTHLPSKSRKMCMTRTHFLQEKKNHSISHYSWINLANSRQGMTDWQRFKNLTQWHPNLKPWKNASGHIQIWDKGEHAFLTNCQTCHVKQKHKKNKDFRNAEKTAAFKHQ
jgi:hypothetical protein